jgi:lipoate---protein ligase
MSLSLSARQIGRLIPSFEAPGLLQMQIDRWLLQEHIADRQPPILRFYQWSPAAISLGYHQHRYPDHWSSLEYQGVPLDLVRRPSGGRAVLHQGDLTYGLILTSPIANRTELYQYLCQFLILGWQRLGLELIYGNRGREYRDQANCFATATGADLVLPDGYKLIGSAQLRKDGATLQHGSIRLQPDPDLWQTVFHEVPLTPPALLSQYSPAEIGDRLAVAAAEVLNIDWQVQPLEAWEIAAAQASGTLTSS